jgi:hypothetical protein
MQEKNLLGVCILTCGGEADCYARGIAAERLVKGALWAMMVQGGYKKGGREGEGERVVFYSASGGRNIERADR